jgi:hypothetical protein
MNIDLCLIIGIIVVFVLLSYLWVKNTKEYFQVTSMNRGGSSGDGSGPNADAELLSNAERLGALGANGSNNGNSGSNSSNSNDLGKHDEDDIDMDNYVRREDLKTVAREAAYEFCPVTSDYNPSNYVKKSEIDLQKACPSQPNLKDYVLKSTIPPIQKCPSCVCPKVRVEAGLCKKCPEPKNNCPKPKPCDAEQCKDVIKCEPWQKQVSCPKCPAPEACPQLPEKVCPALTIHKPDFKCPGAKPCPVPNACKDGEGRCPDTKCPKCTFKGVEKTSTEDMINELLESNDPRLQELLEMLKNKLDLNQSVSPSDIDGMRADLNKLMAMKNGIPRTTAAAPTAAPTLASNSLTLRTNEITNNGRENSLTNNSMSFLNAKPAPKAFDSACEGGQCPYNTNLPI